MSVSDSSQTEDASADMDKVLEDFNKTETGETQEIDHEFTGVNIHHGVSHKYSCSKVVQGVPYIHKFTKDLYFHPSR